MNIMDPAAPVTRDELAQALEIWGGALLARIDQQTTQRMGAMEARLLERFDRGDHRMAAVEARLDRSDHRMAAVEARLDRVDHRIVAMEARLLERIDHCDHRVVAVEGRIERSDHRMVAMEARLLERIEHVEQRREEHLSVELARHARALHEAMRSEFAALDDKYTDLPARVRRLEVSVFPVDER